jgi:hypothetical protein
MFAKLQMLSRRFVAQATYASMFAASLFSASAAMAAYPVSSGPTYVPDMFNYQYCEVLLQVPNSPSGVPVFNTTGYNTCPNYSTLTGQASIDSYNATYYPGNPYGLPSGATGFILDWPRNWIYDQAVEGVPPGTTEYLVLDVPGPSGSNVPITTFGFVGFNANISGLAYTPSNVARDATWTYFANNLIFQLLDPSGNLYVMQSYARFIDPNLTYENLQDVDYMNGQLDLPEDWSYSVAQLAQQFDNISEGNAILLQDDLGNSYMMVDPTLSSLPVTTPVPGPLPIFGVGMAFGFSRRLRARIKKAAA